MKNISGNGNYNYIAVTSQSDLLFSKGKIPPNLNADKDLF